MIFLKKYCLLILSLCIAHSTLYTTCQLAEFNNQALQTCYKLLDSIGPRLEYCAQRTDFSMQHNALLAQQDEIAHHIGTLDIIQSKLTAQSCAQDQQTLYKQYSSTYQKLLSDNADSVGYLIPQALDNYIIVVMNIINNLTPSSFFWQKYSTIVLYGVASIAGLVGLYYYRDNLSDGAQTLERIASNHIVDPIVNFITTLRTTPPDIPKVPSIFPAPEPLEEATTNYARNHQDILEHNYVATHDGDLPTVEIKQQMHEESNRCAKTIILGDDVSKLRRKFRFTDFGRGNSCGTKLILLDALDRNGLIINKYVYELMKVGDYFSKAGDATLKFAHTLMLLSVIPVSHALYKSVSSLFSREVKYPVQIKKLLYWTDALFIKNLNQKDLSLTEQGLVLYWSNRLQSLLKKYIPACYQPMLCQQITSLQNQEYSVAQRKAVLNSMYTLYNFVVRNA